jgi:hypothetical protein
MRDLTGTALHRLLVESSNRISSCVKHEMTVIYELAGCEMRLCSKCGLSRLHIRASLFRRIPPPYRRSDLDRYLESHRAYSFTQRMVRAVEKWGAAR